MKLPPDFRELLEVAAALLEAALWSGLFTLFLIIKQVKILFKPKGNYNREEKIQCRKLVSKV